MTTPSGDFALNYSAAADVSPLTNASMTYIGSDRLRVLSNAVKQASGSFGPIWRYNGSMSSTGVIRIHIEIGSNALTGDVICGYIIDSSGNGYTIRIANTAAVVYLMNAGSVGASIGTSGAIVGTTGNIVTLELTQATHTLVVKEGGTPVTGPGGVESTYTTGLAFGVGTDAQGTGAASFVSFAGDGIQSDTTAPALTSATGAANGARAATGGVTTDTAEGTLYSVLTASATQPSKTQVKTGDNHTGADATYAGSQAVTTTGAKSVAAPSGLTPKVAYYWHHMHEDVAGNQSNVTSSAAFTTHGEITDTDGDNVVTNGQGPVTINGFFGASDPVVRLKSGSISQAQVDTAHTSTTITLSSIARGNLPYTDANHSHVIEVDTDE